MGIWHLVSKISVIHHVGGIECKRTKPVQSVDQSIINQTCFGISLRMLKCSLLSFTKIGWVSDYSHRFRNGRPSLSILVVCFYLNKKDESIIIIIYYWTLYGTILISIHLQSNKCLGVHFFKCRLIINWDKPWGFLCIFFSYTTYSK